MYIFVYFYFNFLYIFYIVNYYVENNIILPFYNFFLQMSATRYSKKIIEYSVNIL